VLKQYLVILGAIVILGIVYVFIEKKISEAPAQNAALSGTPAPATNANTLQEFTSSDGRVTVSFPSSWYVRDTTEKGSSGQFGPYTQTWTVSNYVLPDTGGNTIPENGIKIDFAIQRGGENLPLEALLDCGNKTLTCERVGINNEQFLKSTATLNTGMRTIGAATFYDQNILQVHSMIQTGNEQNTNEAVTQKVVDSVKFSSL
jgi:hypothetical protein